MKDYSNLKGKPIKFIEDEHVGWGFCSDIDNENITLMGGWEGDDEEETKMVCITKDAEYFKNRPEFYKIAYKYTLDAIENGIFDMNSPEPEDINEEPTSALGHNLVCAFE